MITFYDIWKYRIKIGGTKEESKQITPTSSWISLSITPKPYFSLNHPRIFFDNFINGTCEQ